MPRCVGSFAPRLTFILRIALLCGVAIAAQADDSDYPSITNAAACAACSGFVIQASPTNTPGTEDAFSAGPLYDDFSLTLDPGERTEAVGPLFFSQQRDTERSWGLPPLFSWREDPAVEYSGYDILYPLLTCQSYGKEYLWQFCQLLSFSGGQNETNVPADRATLFPIYFQQRSPDTNLDYTALFPIYGDIKGRLFRDEIFFVMFPLYSETHKRDVVTDNYLYPFFDVRHGDRLHGWQFWPVAGQEHKDVTYATNGFGETEIIGGHDRSFILWPLDMRQDNGLGTTNAEKFRASIPFFAVSRSPERDSSSVLWPFFNWIDDREKKYREWELPFPFVVVARGPGKTTTRVFPLYSRAHNDTTESDFYLWPIYGYKRYHDSTLDWERSRILFYLFVDATEKNVETGKARRRVDFLPLFTWHEELNGNRRLQIFAPIEPILPNNGGIERNWSPLWSLWRAEANPRTGAASQSLLWNLYRRDTAPDSKKCSLLFGLFQYQTDGENKRLRLLYIPVLKTHRPAAPAK
ncbi:MAG: hypothetical protein ABSE16_09900 [Verrucomicrobiota bacterium]